MAGVNLSGGAVRGAMAAALLALWGCGAPPASDKTERAGAIGADPEAAAAALGAPADAATRALYEIEYEAVGAEPFWRLDLLNDWVAFTRPGLPEVGALPGRRDYRAEGALIVAGPLMATLRLGDCVHESGETFPFKARVEFEGVAYEGCARAASGQGAAAGRWTSVLPELMPAVDACLARVERKPGRVTIAYLLDNGQASVRLLDADGGRYECGAAAAGGAIQYWEAIGDRDVLQGEREPLFTRAPTAAPAGECFASEEAKGADGAPIGWFSRRIC